MDRSDFFGGASRTRIKFCGITRSEDATEAVRLGVDAIGLVFDPRSKRCVAPATAANVVAPVRGQVTLVALLRDAAAAEVAEVIAALRPQVLQFHGRESEAFCAQWGLPYWKAVPMALPGDVAAWAQRYASAAGLLLDGHAAGEMGGGGRRFDWRHAPRGLPKPWVLAGGLAPGNVFEAVTMTAPGAVDVSSGIESAPGIKDPQKMRDFVAAVRAADEARDA